MKTLLVTGASTGIGEATARRAVEAGYRVALAARSKEKLDALVEELGSNRTVAIACNVQDFESQCAMAQAVLERFSSIDAVFANAGRGANSAGVAGGDIAEWRDMIMTNIYGLMLTVKATHEAVKAARGHFVLTGSIAGRRTNPGSVYGATKWAVTGYGYNLREEMKQDGVKVTLIEPGRVDTPFFDEVQENALEADDVARAVVFALAQPENVILSEIVVEPLRR